MKACCNSYVKGSLARDLASVLPKDCSIVCDKTDVDQSTLLIKYPTLFTNRYGDYALPNVKLEAGARSAVGCAIIAGISPYVSDDLPEEFSFDVENVSVIDPGRTYMDKLMILHGLYCGYRDENRLPRDDSRLSRHYYDVAMITVTDVGKATLNDVALLEHVREHELLAFRQAWKQLEEAVPGKIRLVPEGELCTQIESDYKNMRHMMFGEPPEFDSVMGQIKIAEDAINGV